MVCSSLWSQLLFDPQRNDFSRLSQDTKLLCGDLCGFLENLKVILNSYRHLVHLIEIYINTNNETQFCRSSNLEAKGFDVIIAWESERIIYQTFIYFLKPRILYAWDLDIIRSFYKKCWNTDTIRAAIKEKKQSSECTIDFWSLHKEFMLQICTLRCQLCNPNTCVLDLSDLIPGKLCLCTIGTTL